MTDTIAQRVNDMVMEIAPQSPQSRGDDSDGKQPEPTLLQRRIWSETAPTLHCEASKNLAQNETGMAITRRSDSSLVDEIAGGRGTGDGD